MNFRLAFITATSGLILSCSSCIDEEVSRMPQMEQLKDSVFARYPTVRAVTVNVRQGNTLIFALGDPDLYKKPEAYRDKMGKELGQLTLSVMGKDNNLDKARMIVTPNTRNMDAEPKDGLTTEIDLESLTK